MPAERDETIEIRLRGWLLRALQQRSATTLARLLLGMLLAGSPTLPFILGHAAGRAGRGVLDWPLVACFVPICVIQVVCVVFAFAVLDAVQKRHRAGGAVPGAERRTDESGSK